MALLVQGLQAVSGAVWLVAAVLLTPRIVAAWRPPVARGQAFAMPVAFVAWLMAGFALRWLVWPHALGGMDASELLAWAALYGLSAVCAAWVLLTAWEAR